MPLRRFFNIQTFVSFFSKIERKESSGKRVKGFGHTAELHKLCLSNERGVGARGQAGPCPAPPLTWPQVKYPGEVRGRSSVGTSLPEQFGLRFSAARVWAGVCCGLI